MVSSHSWKQRLLLVAGSSFLMLLLGVTCFGQQPPLAVLTVPRNQAPAVRAVMVWGSRRTGERPCAWVPRDAGGTIPSSSRNLGLSDDQQKKMDDIFNSARLKLIDLSASVQKEEAIMEPLVAADPPDENKLLAQIDRVAQARAELEKANARMLLGIRRQLTHEQWLKLKAERPAACTERCAVHAGPMPGPMPGMGRPGDGRDGQGPDGPDGSPAGQASAIRIETAPRAERRSG